MSRRDYYEVLGVGRDDDASAIKKAYRKLAVQYHPDKNPGDKGAENRFKEAAEAYSVLSDPDARCRYDQFGHDGVAGRAASTGFDPETFADFGDILGDLFGMGSIFGGGGRRRTPRRGADLRYDLEIGLEEAVRGVETKIPVARLSSCASCGGRGAKNASDVESCGQCGGRGQVAYQQGFFTIAKTCGRCGGAGRVIKKACPACQGRGRVRSERELSVKIPPGVADGVQLRVSGEGEAAEGEGGRSGDLYVVLRVREHAYFVREANDLHCDLAVSFSQAALGAKVLVTTLDDEKEIDLPAGTQAGTEIRLRGLGAPSLDGGGRGDQVVHIVVRTPKRLSARQRELLEELAQLDGETPSDRGLFDRVREIFGD